MNSLEVYENQDFSKPTKVIASRFQVKPAKKTEPAVFLDGHFDGFEIAPLNPLLPEEICPLYLFAWQLAGVMTEQEENGTVFVYDLKDPLFDKQKFMIKCHGGQEIRVKISRTCHAILIWSNSYEDRTHKSYYGEHQLQYVQIFGGRDRQFVPVFDNNIQDVAWVDNSESFIVISGT